LGEAPEVSPRSTPSLLTDILAVVPTSEAKVWGETVLERLAELRPEVFGTWTREQLTAALRSLGVDATEQVWGTDPATGQGANRRGFARQAVADATTERDRHRRSDGPV
ncbi:MAG TPA: cell division protein FtsK, partial [Actinomycetes bacterium]|nr:cell division protein FtsK [Actinomycetes bacterium]